MKVIDVRPVSAALVLVGAVAVVAAVALVATGQVGATNSHHVSVSEQQAPSELYRPVVPFSELSDRGQQLFLRTLDDPDQDVETVGPAGRAPDFSYPGDDTRTIYVRYEGTVYRVWTNRQEPFLIPSESERRVGGLALVGMVALAGGVARGLGRT